LSGEVHKYFRKEWNKNENGIMDLVMTEYEEKTKPVISTVMPEEDSTE